MGSFGAGSDTTQLKFQEDNFVVVATWIGGARACRQRDKVLPGVARKGAPGMLKARDKK